VAGISKSKRQKKLEIVRKSISPDINKVTLIPSIVEDFGKK
jgi:hypothetical protein